MSHNKKERHESRVMAVEGLFNYLLRDEYGSPVSIKDVLDHVFSLHEVKGNDFTESLVRITLDNLSKIKVVLKVYAPEFTFDKIAPINRSILILGLSELKYFDTPPIVVINEYIEIAKEFGEDKSAGFVNGVLDAFRKNIGKERENELESQ